MNNTYKHVIIKSILTIIFLVSLSSYSVAAQYNINSYKKSYPYIMLVGGLMPFYSFDISSTSPAYGIGSEFTSEDASNSIAYNAGVTIGYWFKEAWSAFELTLQYNSYSLNQSSRNNEIVNIDGGEFTWKLLYLLQVDFSTSYNYAFPLYYGIGISSTNIDLNYSLSGVDYTENVTGINFPMKIGVKYINDKYVIDVGGEFSVGNKVELNLYTGVGMRF